MTESRKWKIFESNSPKISRCLWLRRGVHKLTSSNHFWIRPEDPDPIEAQGEDWSKEFERNPHSSNTAARIAEFEQARHMRDRAPTKMKNPAGIRTDYKVEGRMSLPAWGQRKVDLKVPGSRHDVERI